MSAKKIIGKIFRFKKSSCRESSFRMDRDFDSLVEELKYELYDEIKDLKRPVIKDVAETIDALVQSRASLCRFGDGELRLIEGNDIEFQKASPLLSSRLGEVLSSRDDRVFIGIPRLIYSSKNGVTELSKRFWRENGKRFRRQLDRYIDYDRPYFSAEVTIAYCMYESLDFGAYFETIRRLWDDRPVVIVCGDGIFNDLKYNVFSNAKSTEYLFCPSVNAFEEYERIHGEASKVDKDAVVCIILGPTAKVLAYDLALEGFQALDLGHIAKAYDWYRRNMCACGETEARLFFSPD